MGAKRGIDVMKIDPWDVVFAVMLLVLIVPALFVHWNMHSRLKVGNDLRKKNDEIIKLLRKATRKVE